MNSACGDRAGLERARGIADGLEVLRDAELAGIAQADHQHARRGDARQVVQQRGLAGLAADVAALQQGAQAAAAGVVQGLRRTGVRLLSAKAPTTMQSVATVAGAAWFRSNSRAIQQIPGEREGISPGGLRTIVRLVCAVQTQRRTAALPVGPNLKSKHKPP